MQLLRSDNHEDLTSQTLHIDAPLMYLLIVARENTEPTAPGPEALSCREPRPQLARIGRYKLLGLLGRGGMGDVYLGLDERLDRQVAIKLLPGRANPSGDPDLPREALALARLAHPNVVTIHEVDAYEGQIYLAMERVDGVTLRTWLAESKHSRAEILAVMLQAGRGLSAVHAAGLVHRDFKPESGRAV